MKFFKPEDFHRYWSDKESCCSPAQAAETANEKLNALIESWPMVYLNDHRNINSGIRFISTEQTKLNTHKARLAFVEKIVKEPCKHEPINTVITDRHKVDLEREIAFNRYPGVSRCKHCGVELQATWSEKK
jgi:hypothetical protein